MAKSNREEGLFASVAAVLLIFFLSACASAPKSGYLLFHPVPPIHEGYSLSQGALRHTAEGFVVTVRPLDWRMVEEKYRLDGLPVPFGEGEKILSYFSTFQVGLENLSTEALTFNPMLASAISGSNEFRTPIELSDLYMSALGEEGIEGRARSFTETCFDGTVTIGAGEKVERYLVFPSPDLKTKALTVVLNDLFLGSESRTLTFLFEAFPGGENEAQP